MGVVILGAGIFSKWLYHIVVFLGERQLHVGTIAHVSLRKGDLDGDGVHDTR